MGIRDKRIKGWKEERTAIRRAEAKKRQRTYDALSTDEKVIIAHHRRMNSEKEINRLTAR